jgi:glutathione synthase/RimK-type ligase-like ATP-grasp enzyme
MTGTDRSPDHSHGKRCAFLSTDDLSAFVTDDALAVESLHDLGWSVDLVPWRAAADWDAYDVVVVRSTWDYQDDADAFDAVLQRIAASRPLLCNPLPLMRWNMRKTYLRELGERGVATLPTAWGASPTMQELAALHDRFDCDEIVIKPVVGANADHAYRVRRTSAELDRICRAYAGREYLAQPFIDAVVGEGEHSLIYFDGAFSHAILKTPKAGDFRVQEEHGGLIRPCTPEPRLRERSDAAIAALDVVPLYARADFVRTADGDFGIMELELIEPSLYFRMDPGSPHRFAQALDRVHAQRLHGVGHTRH